MKEYYRAYAKVDLGAISNNINEIRRHIQNDTKVMAIVKANAYGHGAVMVANALKYQVDAYGVAMIEEALELREAGLDHMILILGYTGQEWYEELIRHHISQTVYDLETAFELNKVAMALGERARIHIKIDTGMNRIGFPLEEETISIIEKISQFQGIEIEGIFTHFARADEATIDGAVEPFGRFSDMVGQIEARGVSIAMKHVSNSASIISYPEANLNMVRAGIITYGIYPSSEVSKEFVKVTPAMELKAFVSQVKIIPPNTPISYGGTFVSKEAMKIATIPIGYADGVKRDLTNKGRVLVHGEYANMVGRICMDQFMIDVTHIENVEKGTRVTLFGSDGNEEISVEEIAEKSHSFSYEYLCSISSRIPRLYVDEK